MLVLTPTENTTPKIAAIAVSAAAIHITRKHVGSNAIDLLVESAGSPQSLAPPAAR